MILYVMIAMNTEMLYESSKGEPYNARGSKCSDSGQHIRSKNGENSGNKNKSILYPYASLACSEINYGVALLVTQHCQVHFCQDSRLSKPHKYRSSHSFLANLQRKRLPSCNSPVRHTIGVYNVSVQLCS